MSETQPDPTDAPGADLMEALPGEPGLPKVATRTPPAVSKIRLAAIAVAVLSVLAFSALEFERWLPSSKRADDASSKQVANRPAAASTSPKTIDMAAPPPASATMSGSTPLIPEILPTTEEAVAPIGVRRTGTPANPAAPVRSTPPEDAPVLLVTVRPSNNAAPSTPGPSTQSRGDSVPAPGDGPSSSLEETRRNLKAYEQQLQGVLDSLGKRAAATSSASPAAPMGRATNAAAFSSTAPTAPATEAPANALLGGQLQGSATPRTFATTLSHRSLILPKGTTFTCALQTKIVSAASGFVNCVVQRNVYGDDGRVLLFERGSQVVGEYRITSFKPGTVRVPVLWTRIKTPNGVTVDLDSPGTGQLGESGVDGYVDNRWGERIGAALLLSLIDDSVQLALQREQSNAQGNSISFPSTTTTSSKLAEKVLDSTINIPPLIYRNQGGIVGVYVARDVDFSSVYELRPTAEGGQPWAP